MNWMSLNKIDLAYRTNKIVFNPMHCMLLSYFFNKLMKSFGPISVVIFINMLNIICNLVYCNWPK